MFNTGKKIIIASAFGIAALMADASYAQSNRYIVVDPAAKPQQTFNQPFNMKGNSDKRFGIKRFQPKNKFKQRHARGRSSNGSATLNRGSAAVTANPAAVTAPALRFNRIGGSSTTDSHSIPNSSAQTPTVNRSTRR